MFEPTNQPADDMIEIELTQGKVALIDEEDLPLVGEYRWHAIKGHNTFYAAIKAKRDEGGNRQRVVLMHRLILGLDDPKIHADHIDGDGLNNRRTNLRACTRAQNMRNTGAHADNSSGYKGVHWNKQRGKWVAQIKCIGKIKHLGLFTTKEAAYEAYCRAAVELHGSFANLG